MRTTVGGVWRSLAGGVSWRSFTVFPNKDATPLDLGILGGGYIRFRRHRVSRYQMAAGIRAIPQIPYRQRVSRYLLGPQSPNLIYLL